MAGAPAARIPGLSSRRERMERTTKKQKGRIQRLARAPSARTVARLLTLAERCQRPRRSPWRDRERRAVLVEAREIILEFQGIIRRKALLSWTLGSAERAQPCRRFANGVSKDKAAMRRHRLSWSNGQTEGQICKLKLVKRQMYGRGNIDLLQAAYGLITAPSSMRQTMTPDVTLTAALAPAKLVGVAQPGRARG